MRSDIQPESPLLTPAEVAALFRVDPKTVTRWAQQGKLRSIRTLGGHRRYREAEIQRSSTGRAPRPADRVSQPDPVSPRLDCVRDLALVARQGRGVLARAVTGLRFPTWASSSGWKSTGQSRRYGLTGRR